MTKIDVINGHTNSIDKIFFNKKEELISCSNNEIITWNPESHKKENSINCTTSTKAINSYYHISQAIYESFEVKEFKTKKLLSFLHIYQKEKDCYSFVFSINNHSTKVSALIDKKYIYVWELQKHETFEIESSFSLENKFETNNLQIYQQSNIV